MNPHPHDDSETDLTANNGRPLHGQAYGGETWVDFLRERERDRERDRDWERERDSGRAEPRLSAHFHPRPPSRTASASSSSSSVDRKRRLTTADSPVRRPSGMRETTTTTTTTTSHGSHGSSADPIVLDPSPAPPPLRERPLPPPPPPPDYTPSSQTIPRPFRRESDLVLPPWQPDADVAACPVCNRHFTFLFRKHHCRKCGRVVCSQCSPHRITIPRQFIVHPPSDVLQTIIDLTGDDNDDANPLANFGPFRNPALGGGEEVRVCNPCVPDPNYSLPPQQYATPATRPQYSPAGYQPSHRSSSSVHLVPRAADRRQSQSSRASNSNRRVSYHDASHSEDRWPSPHPNLGHVYPHQHDQSTSSSRPPAGLGPSYIPQPHHPHQYRSGSGSSSARAGDMFPRPFYIPSQPPPIQQLNPRPRRQIAEEDECPICGGELPAKGPDGDDSARSQHIEECIALHSSSPAPNTNTTTRPQAQTSASLPATRTRGMSSAGAGEGSSHRHSHAARGMFPYIATEKDCVDEDGNDAECVICFEEFQAGDKMARLVCWCKFHETCIKEWWKMKGRGACPTHQLHEE